LGDDCVEAVPAEDLLIGDGIGLDRDLLVGDGIELDRDLLVGSMRVLDRDLLIGSMRVLDRDLLVGSMRVLDRDPLVVHDSKMSMNRNLLTKVDRLWLKCCWRVSVWAEIN
jgi:hypothetical protein